LMAGLTELSPVIGSLLFYRNSTRADASEGMDN
jgi:hypothetical protein